MTKVKPFISQDFFTDGAHGWLKVTRARVNALKIADKISACSFMRGKYVYLEEDCDLSLYVDAIRKQENVSTEEYGVFMREFWNRTTTNDSSCSDRQCKIRGYNRFVNYSEAELNEQKELTIKLLDNRRWSTKDRNRLKNGSLAELRHWIDYFNIK